MFGNSLEKEYEALSEAFNFDIKEIFNIIVNSNNTTWLEEKEKQKLIKEFKQYIINIT